MDLGKWDDKEWPGDWLTWRVYKEIIQSLYDWEDAIDLARKEQYQHQRTIKLVETLADQMIRNVKADIRPGFYQDLLCGVLENVEWSWIADKILEMKENEQGDEPSDSKG